MRLTDFLLGPASRQVQYFPDLVPILGSVTATILFGQLLYWSDKGADPDGWIYKSQTEINQETALSREEQETARKKLKDAGILKEKKKGIPCRLWFLLDIDKVNELWEKGQQYSQYEGKPQTSMRHCRKQACGNAADKSEGKPQATSLNYAADYHQNTAAEPKPAAALSPSARPPKKQTLSPEIEAAIQALPIEHHADARESCEEEEVTDQVKLDALAWFAKKLAAGKAKHCGLLRDAIRKKRGAAAPPPAAETDKDKAYSFYSSLPPDKQDELVRLGRITPGGSKDPVYFGWRALRLDPDSSSLFVV